jgi:amino acid adenylation domain-containing protein
MLVQRMLEEGARKWPDKVAVVAGDQKATYAELDEAANQLGHALQGAGVRRGDRVVILVDSSVEAVVSIFGVLKAGATFVMLHTGTRRDRLAFILESAEATALITESIRVRHATDVLNAAPSLRCVVWADDRPLQTSDSICTLTWSELAALPALEPPCPAIDLDLAMLIYTSGSTGEPKGVMVSHANMLSATRMVNAYLHNTVNDIILNVLPLAHGYGLYQVFLAFDVGARVVLESGFGFPARIIGLIAREQVTALPGVPTFFALLLRYPDLLRRQFPHLRYLTNAAAALPTAHIQQLRAAFPSARIISMYGQTECKRVSYLPAEELDRRPDSVGIAIPNSEVYIVDEAERRLPPGEVGELVVRGAHVTRGYWRSPELTARKFRPGPLPGETVLYTGDLFRADADGYLYFVSRKDDMIKCRGEKVSPREVENTVCRMDGVAEAAVVGVDDEVLGQAILLVLVPHPSAHLDERAVRAFCLRTLDDYMQPKYVDLVAELPRNENGKVDKRRILAEFASARPA